MRILSWKQCLAAAGKTEQWFQSIRRRKQVALAWGLSEETPRGIYCDIDAAVLRLTADLASGTGPTKAAHLMRLHADAWMEAVAHADVEKSAVFLLYVEYNWGRDYNITAMTLDHFQKLVKNPDKRYNPTRMVWLNVTATLQDIRANAARIGLDLSGAFLPPPSDPLYEKLVSKRRLARDKALNMLREHEQQRHAATN